MKRFLALLLPLLLPLGAAAEKYCTITQLRAQAPAQWTQTYATPWRDIAVDAPVLLPQADALPVITVAYDLNEVISASGHWDVCRTPGGMLSIDIGSVDDQRPRGIFHSAQYDIPYDTAAFAPGSREDVSAALTMAEAMLRDCGMPEGLFDLSCPAQVAVWWITDRQGKQVGRCEYCLTLRQQLCGIRLLGHAFMGMPGSMREGKGGEYSASVGATLRYISGEHASFSGDTLRETGRAAEDMPLCGFDRVRQTLEAEIMAGRLRRVDEVELGYVLYNVPGAAKDPGKYWRQGAAYWAVPTWMISGIYVEDPALDWSPADDPGQPVRSDLHYAFLLLDAQTGQLLPRERSRERGAADYRGVVTWEDAGQSPGQ
ncbi:MAG: hypothetical protein ACI4O7_15185 [Aristaeellaceae bacterium]